MFAKIHHLTLYHSFSERKIQYIKGTYPIKDIPQFQKCKIMCPRIKEQGYVNIVMSVFIY